MEHLRASRQLNVRTLQEHQQLVVAKEQALPVRFIGLGSKEGMHTFTVGNVFTIQAIGKLNQPYVQIKAGGHPCPMMIHADELQKLEVEDD